MKSYTLKQLIEIAKTFDKKSTYWKYNELSDKLGFQYFDIDEEDNLLTSVDLNPHVCTDTWVGIEIIFLDNEFVAVSNQLARKSETDYYFKDKESKEKLIKYFTQFINNDVDVEFLTEELLNEDYNIGYHVKYAYTHIGNKAYLEENDKYIEVDIIRGKECEEAKKYSNFHNVRIKLPNDIEKVVTTNDLLFPYFPTYNFNR